MKNKKMIARMMACAVMASGASMAFGQNFALDGTAYQTSDWPGLTADLAIDGNLGNFSHTADGATEDQTWGVELASLSSIDSIVLHNRDNCCQGRLQDLTINIYANDTDPAIFTSELLNPGNILGGPESITLDVTAANGGSPVDGLFVEVTRTSNLTLAGHDGYILALGEVMVLGVDGLPEPPPDRNVAKGKPATQSTTAHGRPAGNATDGNFGNETHTAAGNDGLGDPFWAVDLEDDFILDEIILHNRPSCCGERLRDIVVTIRDHADTTDLFVSELLNPANELGSPATIELDLIALTGGTVTGGRVIVTRMADAGATGDDADVLSLGEVVVNGQAVPEPASAALALLGAGSLMMRRRK